MGNVIFPEMFFEHWNGISQKSCQAGPEKNFREKISGNLWAGGPGLGQSQARPRAESGQASGRGEPEVLCAGDGAESLVGK